jgi:hypothetical protein
VSERPKVGQRVRFTATLRRWKNIKGEAGWDQIPCEPTEGCYTGIRTVFFGKVDGMAVYDHEYGQRDDQPYLRVESSVTHALVVTDPRYNPKRVPFEALEVLP